MLESDGQLIRVQRALPNRIWTLVKVLRPGGAWVWLSNTGTEALAAKFLECREPGDEILIYRYVKPRVKGSRWRTRGGVNSLF